MTMPIIPCWSCVHYNKKTKTSCKAFDKIPEKIMFGENDHTQPYKGDNGIQFEPIK